MEFSVHRPSPPNTYSYVQEENSGSTRKLVENHLLLTCATIKSFCNKIVIRSERINLGKHVGVLNLDLVARL
jgi:hypothetical protein